MSALLLPLYIVVFVGLIYFIGVRPQQRRRRQLEDLVSKLSPGDDVVTIAGIHGRVTEVEEGDTILLEVAEDLDIRVSKASIAQIVASADEPIPAEASTDG